MHTFRKTSFTPAFPFAADSEMLRLQPMAEVLFTAFSVTHILASVPSATDIALVFIKTIASVR